VQHGNVNAEAILEFAVTSRNIIAMMLEIPSIEMVDAALFNDVEEYRAYDAFLERSRAGTFLIWLRATLCFQEGNPNTLESGHRGSACSFFAVA